MKIYDLEKVFLQAKNKNYNFVGILVEIKGFKAPEIIINDNINIDDKLNYYKKTYDENLSHRFSGDVRIINASCANSCDEIYNNLLGNKSFFDLLIDNEITIEDIQLYIDKWSSSTSELSIYEYLGLTREQYDHFQSTGQIIF